MTTLHGIFNGSESAIGDFDGWTGKPAAVVTKFVNTVAFYEQNNKSPSGYINGEIDPVWEYGHIPLLTLEPHGDDNIEWETAEGKRDGMWQAWADAIGDYVRSHNDPKLYIRLAHEMNGDWYPWSQNPGNYVEMWKRVRDMILDQNGVTNDHVKFIWCVNSDDTADTKAEQYYPGDQYVDWVAIDGYNFGSSASWSSWRSPGETFNDMLSRVRSVSGDKPVAIPETGCSSQKGGSSDRGAKANWLHQLFNWLDNKNIGLVSYFNTDKETDWSVFGYGKQYTAYKNEVQKSRVLGSQGDDVITQAEFNGDFSGGGSGGDGSNTGGDNNDNTMANYDFVLGIGNPNSDTKAEYDIYVNGTLGEHDGTLEKLGDDLKSDFHITGSVKGGWDEIEITGWITSFSLNGGAQVTIDGNSVGRKGALDYRPDRFSNSGGSSSDSGSSGGQVITVSDSGSDSKNSYRIIASEGEITNSTARGASSSQGEFDKNANGEPRVSDAVYGGSDSWNYEGSIQNVGLSNPSTAEINIGDGAKPAESYDFVYQIGGGGSSSSDTGGSSGGDSGGSSGSETSSGGNRVEGSAGGSSGAYIIQPGDVQSALDDLQEDSGNAPKNERRSAGKLAPNATFDPGNTVHLPRDFTLDASAASIVPGASYDLFTFDMGSQLLNPYVNLRGVGSGNEYDARVFTFDPENITYGANKNDRNSGFVDKDAWKPRDGTPHNKYRFEEHERQNFFANGTGVKGGRTLAKPRDNSTLFYYHQDTDRGWQCSCLALFENSHSAREVAYPIDINSEGPSFINDIRVKGFYTGFDNGITIRGQGTARKNYFDVDLQPQSGISEHMVLIDNPEAQRNYITGCTWDAHKVANSNEAIKIRRATGQNVVRSMTGHNNAILSDDTNDSSNKVVNPF